MQAHINITPLVDVVLVLLIIFMVVTPLLQSAYDVTVPEKASSPLPQTARLIVRQEGPEGFYLNSEPVSRRQLRQRLREILKHNKIVFFDGADTLSYGDAAATLDILHDCGATQLGIVTATMKTQ